MAFGSLGFTMLILQLRLFLFTFDALGFTGSGFRSWSVERLARWAEAELRNSPTFRTAVCVAVSMYVSAEQMCTC